MTNEEDKTLIEMIASQEIAITELTNRLRVRDELMQAAIAEANRLHKTLSSTFLRMLDARTRRS